MQRRLLPEDETAGRRIFYGTVTDASGAPLNGVKLRMAWSGAAPGTDFPTTTTGRDPYKPAGSYEFVHSPGTFNLQVVQGDWPSDLAADLETAKVPGREGQAITYEVNFRLQAVGAPAQVDGVVAGGAADALLTLTAADDTVRTTRLAADGSFVFPNLPANAAAWRHRRLPRDRAGTGRVFAALPMRSRLSGHVVDAGAPCDGLVVAVRRPPWGWARQGAARTQRQLRHRQPPQAATPLEVNGLMLPDLVLNGENETKLAVPTTSQGQQHRAAAADGAGRPQADVLMTSGDILKLRPHGCGFLPVRQAAAGSYLLEAVGLGQAAFLLDGERQEVADVLYAARPAGSCRAMSGMQRARRLRRLGALLAAGGRRRCRPT